ncbi:hypothetical protein EK904_004764 [Melospiza melodia maxima]|nr:hypothetical protein EK904_004764 [Melospiza melodia maxima]
MHPSEASYPNYSLMKLVVLWRMISFFLTKIVIVQHCRQHAYQRNKKADALHHASNCSVRAKSMAKTLQECHAIAWPSNSLLTLHLNTLTDCNGNVNQRAQRDTLSDTPYTDIGILSSLTRSLSLL